MVIICPRCGQPASYIERRRVGDREYLYAVHEYRDKQKGRVRIKHYLGPADGYEYVSRTHSDDLRELQGLGTGIEDVHARNLVYLEHLLHWFSICGKKETVERALQIIQKWLPKIAERFKELEELEKKEKKI
jgi:hypothetical protein